MSNLLDGPQQHTTDGGKKEQRKNVAKILTLRAGLASGKFKEELEKAIPDEELRLRFMRCVFSSLMRNPKLEECDASSALTRIIDLAISGLEPDGRNAHLVPRWNKSLNANEVTVNIDYKGYVDLMFRAGFVSSVYAAAIYEGDYFAFNTGEIEHVSWDWRRDKGKPSNKGRQIGAYCTVTFRNGGRQSHAMTLQEIEAIRSRSPSSDSGPWKTDYIEMCKKTVFRQLQKWLPVTHRLQHAVESENDDMVIDATPTPLGLDDVINGRKATEQPQTEPARIEYTEEAVPLFIPEVVAEPVAVADNVAEEKPQRSRKKQEPFAELGDGQL